MADGDKTTARGRPATGRSCAFLQGGTLCLPSGRRSFETDGSL